LFPSTIIWIFSETAETPQVKAILFYNHGTAMPIEVLRAPAMLMLLL